MDSLAALFSLRGHVGLVTGASSGLGIECAAALAAAGADVAVVARRKERLEAVAARLREFGGRAIALAADITDDAELERVVSRVAAELGEIDILVNNAGKAGGGGARRLSRADWETVLAVDLTAPMMLAQKVARRLIARRKPGRIINVTSINAGLASPYPMANYVAAKGALMNLTRQLAVEWARHSITVNAISPGMIPTEFNRESLARPGIRERTERFTPLGRLGRPEEMRGAVVFLASAAASYVTGSTIAVDGGYCSW